MSQNKSITTGAVDAKAKRAAPAVLALILGMFMVVGVGFAGSEAIHNAAHDARHAFAFPCH